jgi:anti-anti-sigma regulatory factor
MDTYPIPQAIAGRSPDDIRPGQLRIDGCLTINEAATWHATLKERVSAGVALDLDLSSVTTVDLIGLQLLASARRAAENAGLAFQVIGNGSSVLRACEQAGVAPSEVGLAGKGGRR